AKALVIQSCGEGLTGRSLLLPESLGKIFCRVVGEDGDDHGAFAARNVPGHFEAANERGGSARADEKALFTGQTFCEAIRILSADEEVLVGQGIVVNGRAQSRGHVLPAFKAMEGTLGLKADAANRGVQFTQAARHADKGAARAQAGDKMGEAATRLRPDFMRG